MNGFAEILAVIETSCESEKLEGHEGHEGHEGGFAIDGTKAFQSVDSALVLAFVWPLTGEGAWLAHLRNEYSSASYRELREAQGRSLR